MTVLALLIVVGAFGCFVFVSMLFHHLITENQNEIDRMAEAKGDELTARFALSESGDGFEKSFPLREYGGGLRHLEPEEKATLAVYYAKETAIATAGTCRSVRLIASLVATVSLFWFLIEVVPVIVRFVDKQTG